MPDPAHDPARTGPSTSRRALLTGAGVATAAGLAVTATAGAGPATADTTSRSGVAQGPPGVTAVEFRGRITQSGDTGESFSSLGFLTAVRGLPAGALFDGSGTDVTTALFTASATGRLTSRVLDMSVHALDIIGTMSVYRRRAGGADWAVPSSFTTGRLLATYALTLQDVLTVFAPGKGLPTLSGTMRQVSANAVSPVSEVTFGSVGLLLRMLATGVGTLVDPVTLNAELEIAGGWVVP